MIQLFDQTSNQPIGSISESQLRFLQSQMEEESMEDQDYAITPMTLDYFTTLGAEDALVSMLRQALGGRDEMVIRWEEA